MTEAEQERAQREKIDRGPEARQFWKSQELARLKALGFFYTATGKAITTTRCGTQDDTTIPYAQALQEFDTLYDL